MAKKLTSAEAWYLLEEAIATVAAVGPTGLNEEESVKVNKQLVKFRDEYFAYENGDGTTKDEWVEVPGKD